MLMYFDWELVFLPLRQCRPAKQGPAVQACDYVSSPHCLPQIPQQQTCRSLHQRMGACSQTEAPWIKSACFLDMHVCDISSAYACVPKKHICRRTGVQRGRFCQSTGCGLKTARDSNWCQWGSPTLHDSAWKNQRENERSNFHPERARSFSR